MNDTVKEFDLGELVGGNVNSIVEKLPNLSDVELAQLRSIEGGGAKRSSLMAAIDAEGAARERRVKDAHQAEIDKAVAEGKAGLFSQAELDQAVADALAADAPKSAEDEGAKPATFSQEQVDAQITILREQHAHDMKIAVAKAREDKQVKPKKDAVAKAMEIDGKGDGPALVALTGPSQVQFVDDQDVPIKALPAMIFAASDYEPAGDRVKLKRDVDFPVTLPELAVAGAFMLDDKGRACGKAELVIPFGVGGGRSSRLPSGTLSFAGAAAAG